MAKSKFDMEVLGLFLILVVCLALTPTIATSLTDAKFIPETEYKIIDADVSNSTTALTNAARNDSATYAYFTITLNDTSAYGLTTIEEATNITYTVVTKIVLFKTGVFTSTKAYNCSITYYWQYITGGSSALLDLVPVLWIIAVIAVVVVVAARKLHLG